MICGHTVLSSSFGYRYSSLTEALTDEIMSAILPEGQQDELPTGFSIVGHVGRLCEADLYRSVRTESLYSPLESTGSISAV